jgi:hypothetical protein
MSELYIAPEMVMDDVAKLDSAILFGSRSIASRPAVEGFDPAIMIGSQITDETDWDFSAPYSEKNHNTLIESGFMYWPPEDLSYKDSLTTGVYIKKYIHKFDMKNPTIYSSAPVANVVLRNDHAIFCQAWNSVDPKFYHDFLWKRSPNYEFQELGLTKNKIRDIMNQLFKTTRHMIWVTISG